MKTLYSLALAALATAAISSCSHDSSKWHLNGSIDGLSEGETLILEGNNQGYWYTIDTIVPSKDGKINYAGDVHGYPDIFRLRLGNSSLYFPVDSLETVTVNASAPDIAATHTLGGSPQALNMNRVDSLINATASRVGAKGVAADEDLKRQLGEMIVADPSGVVSYYIISRRLGDTPLFNPAVAIDHRLIGAVANAFTQMRPDDPRTKYLKNLYLTNRRQSPNSQGGKMEATLIKAFDIELYDQIGKRHSLLELTESGRPVILNFTAYAADWSPAFNIELNKVYEKYRNAGLEIYQVSLDADEYSWKQTAKNLPWITVLNDVSKGDKYIRQYNVGALPTTFVFNRNGELVERVLDIDDLDSAVGKNI